MKTTSQVAPMTPEQLTQLLSRNEQLVILDVRNNVDYSQWKIEGNTITSINVPYFELIDQVDPALALIPEGRDVLVVCAKEGSSIFVAEQLAEARPNVTIRYLQGGMKAWSEYLHPVKVVQDAELTIYQFIRMGKGCLSYMVISGNEALVVDPARMIDRYQQLATSEGVTITHIVDSHLHADHISGGKTLADATGANYYLMRSEGAVFAFEAFEEHERIDFANVQLEVLAVKTPGHTPGSVSFLVNNRYLFSGDTLFVGGLGRPDLGGKAAEWAQDLYESIHAKVNQMADDVVVLPSHYASFDDEVGPAGYIGAFLGDIRERNEMMQEVSRQVFVEHVAGAANTETPPNFEAIVAINRGVEFVDDEKLRELEIGPNRCAVHHSH